MSFSLGQLRTLRRKAHREDFRQGEILFRQGDPGDRIFLIRRGLVEIYTEARGLRRRLNLAGRGEVIGEMALLDGDGRSACALARTEVQVLSLGRGDWEALLESQPGLVHGLTRQLSQRLRQLQATLGAELDRRDNALRHGQMNTIGPFRLQDRLGEGGMGVIYAAVHQHNEREYAVKIIPAHSEEQRQRFTRECESMARLIHPHIVRIDSGGVEGYYAYMSMELLRGETLESRLQRGPLLEREARRWFGPALEALSYAHETGILHRDIKPGNLFMTLDGTTKVLDFGIARRVNGPDLTVEGKLMGTPQYLAPERIGGRSRSHERLSDQYSLGVCMYQALTGVCPFQYDDVAEILAAHLHRPPQPPSRLCSLSPGMENLILRLLAKDPLRRFSSMREASKAFQQLTWPGSDPATLDFRTHP